MTSAPSVKTVDFLTVYFRSPVDPVTAEAKVSIHAEPLFREVASQYPRIFDARRDEEYLLIKITEYGLAFWDGIKCYRKEYGQ